MIEIRKHAEGIVREVTTTQQKTLRLAADRFKTVASAPAGEVYALGVGATRDVMTHNANAQKKLGDSILRRLTRIEGVPEQTRQISDKVQKLTQRRSWKELVASLSGRKPSAKTKAPGSRKRTPTKRKTRSTTSKAKATAKPASA